MMIFLVLWSINSSAQDITMSQSKGELFSEQDFGKLTTVFVDTT